MPTVSESSQRQCATIIPSLFGENIFAVFQTATDWSTHVNTKGKIYNVQERRGSRVRDMMNHEIWLDTIN